MFPPLNELYIDFNCYFDMIFTQVGSNSPA
nr:MAG TPA: hypothetical protein [Caudoviricetes sp.]